jgi:hypothetical protein
LTAGAMGRSILVLLLVLLLSVPPSVASAGVTLHMIARHSSTPIAVRLEPVAIGGPVHGLGKPALRRIAGRLAVTSAELRASGATEETVDDMTARVIDRTGCEVVNRLFLVPRGFTDQTAIADRISLEASFHRAVVTRIAEWSLQPSSSTAPQFGRVIAVVYLSDCPAPRA